MFRIPLIDHRLLLLLTLSLGLLACQSQEQAQTDEPTQARDQLRAYEAKVKQVEDATLTDPIVEWDYFQTEVGELRERIEAMQEDYNVEMKESLAILDQRWEDATARWQARLDEQPYYQAHAEVERYVEQVADSVANGKVRRWPPIREEMEEKIQAMEAAAKSSGSAKVVNDRSLFTERLEMIHEDWVEQQ